MNFLIFKKICEKHGVVEIASRLGFRDTNRIKTWIKRREIPKYMIVIIKTVLKDLQ